MSNSSLRQTHSSSRITIPAPVGGVNLSRIASFRQQVCRCRLLTREAHHILPAGLRGAMAHTVAARSCGIGATELRVAIFQPRDRHSCSRAPRARLSFHAKGDDFSPPPVYCPEDVIGDCGECRRGGRGCLWLGPVELARPTLTNHFAATATTSGTRWTRRTEVSSSPLQCSEQRSVGLPVVYRGGCFGAVTVTIDCVRLITRLRIQSAYCSPHRKRFQT